MHFHLIVQDGLGTQIDAFNLRSGQVVVLGREAVCDVVLPSPSVSRRHARFSAQGGSCIVEDLQSVNGVVVDGMRIHGSQVLPPTATVLVGDFRIDVSAQTASLREPDSGLSVYTSPPRLVGVSPEVDGELYELTGDEISIGRTEASNVQILSTAVSRHHARITRQSNDYVIIDLRSANGTTVNGTAASTPIILRDGDDVRFGRLKFRFELAGNTRNRKRAASARRAEERRRPLILAIALALVVVAGLIIVLATRDSDPETSNTTTAEAWEVDLSAGREAAAAGSWESAVEHYRNALTGNPQDETVRAELGRAEAELEAHTAYVACQVQVETAEGLQAAGQAIAAAEALAQAQSCLAAVPDGTQAGTEARRYSADELTPELITLYRYLGAASLESLDYDTAVQSFSLAHAAYQANPSLEVPPAFRDQYRVALIGSGDAAAERSSWQVVVERYELANTFAPLDDERRRRLRHAREELE